MNVMYKKYKGLGVLAVMVLILTVALAPAAFAVPAETRTVPLDLTTEASGENPAQGWAWDATDREWTLSGIDFDIAQFAGNMWGVRVPADTTIIVENGSTNSIVTADSPNAGTNIAIQAHGALTIRNEAGSGTSGTLDIAAGQGINIYGIHYWVAPAAPLTLDGGTVSIATANATDTTFAGFSEGIAWHGNFYINSGNLTVESGNAPMQTYGINVSNAGTIYVGLPGTPSPNDPLVTAIGGNSVGSAYGGDARLGHHSIGMMAGEINFRNGTAVAQSGTTANPAAMSSAFWGWVDAITLSEFAFIAVPAGGVLGLATNATPLAYSVVRDSTGETVQTNATVTVEGFTVTYDGNGNTAGTAPVVDTLFSIDSSKTVLGQGTLERTDHRFLGWALSADATTPDFLEGAEKTVTGNVTLFAVWERIPTEDGSTETTPPVLGPGPGGPGDDTTGPQGDDDTEGDVQGGVDGDDDATDDDAAAAGTDDETRTATVGPKTGDVVNWFMQTAVVAALLAALASAGLLRSKKDEDELATDTLDPRFVRF